LCHELHELLKTNLTSIIGVEIWHGDVYKCSSWFVSTIFEIPSQIEWGQHTIVILIKEIEELFVDFYVSDWALGDDELFGVKVDIFSGAREAVSLLSFGSGTFFNAFSRSETLPVSSSEFAQGSAHQWIKVGK
jgi:hypothetical protein